MSKFCIINLGIYRTGTTTLAKTFQELGHVVHRTFPSLSPQDHRAFLEDFEEHVCKWWFEKGGKKEFVGWIRQSTLICDGWAPLLAFLPHTELEALQTDLDNLHGKIVRFVATTRDVEAMVLSELHHWILHDLEAAAQLDSNGKSRLEGSIRARALSHRERVAYLQGQAFLSILKLPLEQVSEWALLLHSGLSKSVDLSHAELSASLEMAGKQNATPSLPLEGILLTFRLTIESEEGVIRLLHQVEKDALCRYMVVIGLDSDQIDSPRRLELEKRLRFEFPRMEQLVIQDNGVDQGVSPFPACQIWDDLARTAWSKDADWVVFLGDDIQLHCAYHYRAIYQAFVRLTKTGFPRWFGCPWFDDLSFPGFPTFPVVGRAHRDVFLGDSLIPSHRMACFVNQDLDPYLQRLYLGVGAAPPLTGIHLENEHGGNNLAPARYVRKEAEGWKYFVLEDVKVMEGYLQSRMSVQDIKSTRPIVLDIVIPTYRLSMPYLEGLVSLVVPPRFRTTIIVIVDNPDLLLNRYPHCGGIAQAAMALEQQLVAFCRTRDCQNNIRVRSQETNLGASAARNFGMSESSAEYILFLDDDVRPSKNLLSKYEAAILEKQRQDENASAGNHVVVGFVGMVKFPRTPTMPLKHAAVLMSYLTFMFEIANKTKMYAYPAWGVTANILYQRLPGVHFDTSYAKTGGGEDVDFSLRLLKEDGIGWKEAMAMGVPILSSSETKSNLEKRRLLKSVPDALVEHDFWPGSILDLSWHFFSWAVGDSALFERFPERCYRSYPNVVETVFLLWTTILTSGFVYSLWLAAGVGNLSHVNITTLVVIDCLKSLGILFLTNILGLVAVDSMVELLHVQDFQHRRALLEHKRPLHFCVAACLLANVYVIVLETGRLVGHTRRRALHRHLGMRFDWHCGRLQNAPQNFCRREQIKFCAFVALIAWQVSAFVG